MRFGYARISTSDQNPDLQIARLDEAGCERIVIERASGARADRPELKRLLTDTLRAGDTLVIWKLDRLARSLRHLLEIAADLKSRDVHLVSLTDGIDTTSAAGVLTFHLLGAIAEFERALILERTQAGLAEARKKGRVGGRPRVLSGKDLLAMRALGDEKKFSPSDIAARFNISRATLYRYMKDETE